MESSRREFLMASALTASATAGLDSLTPQNAVASEHKTFDEQMITIAGYKLDRVEALIDGRVKIQGYDSKFVQDSIGNMNTHVFAGPKTRQVTEIGLSPYMLAFANAGLDDYTLIPVFPLRMFRHKSIFINTDSGINSPGDLRGRRIATPGYSSTSLTWIRGFMQHEYGVRPDEIQWVVSAEDSSKGLSGGASDFESIIPEGLSISKGPAGMDESDMLVNGKVDALFHAAEPRAYIQGHSKVARLFPDYRTTERAYYAKTQIFPAMHAVAVHKGFVREHPEFPKLVFQAYSRAKKLMYEYINKHAWYATSLPWIAQEIQETRELMGDNFWPYGIEPNRKALEALFQYSYEQGLAARHLKIEELFHPSTMDLVEE